MVSTQNRGFILTVLFLVGLGVVQVYSSSFIFAIESKSDGLYFFRKQLVFAILSLIVFVLTIKIPWRFIEKYGFLFWVSATVLLVLTFIPGFAIKAGGAFRWIKLPFGLRIEPAELLKYSFPVFLAFFIAHPMKSLGKYKWLVAVSLSSFPLIMLLKQPDFGSFFICFTIGFVMAFTFGLPLKYIFSGFVLSIPAFYFLVVQVPYRYSRVLTFLDPWQDPENKGFQIIQSMLSYYSGGVWGAGMGQGQGKLFFLPEAHTDFTLSVLAEEMGFIGFMIVLLLFGFLIFKGFQIILHTEKVFARAVAIGIVTCFSLSVVINVGVTLGLLPTKGLSLPFLSYGGSSLVATCFGLGLLLNIDKENRRLDEKKNFIGI